MTFSFLLMGFAGGPVLAETMPVIISIEFDDGHLDQIQADSMLSSHGMLGTFFINSGNIGKIGHMTLAQIRTIAANGHEIAGHTVSHADLPTLSLAERQREVCNDRFNLLGSGFQIYDFAFPYGDGDATGESVVQACGYNSGRSIGGIVNLDTCLNCPFAETLPPRDLWATRTPDSIKSNMTLADLQNYVMQAEENGGGWLQLVIHHLCSGTDCDMLYLGFSIDPELLGSFLDWLQIHNVMTGSQVKTVHEVLGGSLQPPVNGPPPTSTFLQNTSLEEPTTGLLPTCWNFINISGDDGTFPDGVGSRTSDSRSGLEAFNITATTMPFNAASQVYSSQDLGDCAPAITVGDIYKLTAWYKTSSQVRLVAYLRNSAGGWSFFVQSPFLPASDDWAEVRWTLPAIPIGATGISVGASLRSAGSLTVDDFSLIDTSSDTTAPTVSVTAPSDGAIVNNTVTLNADAADDVGVTKIEFYEGATLLQTLTAGPYSIDWDTTAVPNDVYLLTAKAYDAAGNSTTSTAISVSVLNLTPPDTTPPTVAINAPTDNATITGVVSIEANAADDVGVARVEFYVGTSLIQTVANSPYSTVWDTTTVANGVYQLTAKAFDSADNSTTSTVISVNVSNIIIVPDTTSPIADINAPADNATISGVISIIANASDNVGVTSVEFYLDTFLIQTVTAEPFSIIWDTTTVPNGIYSLTAKAYDAVGNSTRSTGTHVNISNLTLPSDTVAPTTMLACNGTSCSSGRYTSAVTITLTATDNAGGSGLVSTRYSTDGTDPTLMNGIVYSGAFTVSQTSTIKYRSFDNAGNTEAVQMIVIQITAPQPPPGGGGGGGGGQGNGGGLSGGGCNQTDGPSRDASELIFCCFVLMGLSWLRRHRNPKGR